MKDLDFDELDRAVNSLVASESGSSDVTEAKENTINLTIPPPPPLAGRRSTGKFMDVVHPSSNMRTTLVAPERSSRQGTTISPVSQVPTTSDDKTNTAPVDTPATVKPSTNQWPDPIDFQELSNNVAEKEEESDKNKNAENDQISKDITDALNQGDDEPQDSPFLSGAKVDKRPLGAFSTETTAPTAEPQAQETMPSQVADADTDSKPSDTDTPLPAELQDDLLLIESGGSMLLDDESSPAEVSPTATNAPATTDNKPVGPTSITQQYKEQPSTGDQNTGAIYDTNAYHKAIVRPAKKKSGWSWVLWIIVLLAVGASIGAVVYFYVLPH